LNFNSKQFIELYFAFIEFDRIPSWIKPFLNVKLFTNKIVTRPQPFNFYFEHYDLKLV